MYLSEVGVGEGVLSRRRRGKEGRGDCVGAVVVGDEEKGGDVIVERLGGVWRSCCQRSEYLC